MLIQVGQRLDAYRPETFLHSYRQKCLLDVLARPYLQHGKRFVAGDYRGGTWIMHIGQLTLSAATRIPPTGLLQRPSDQAQARESDDRSSVSENSALFADAIAAISTCAS